MEDCHSPFRSGYTLSPKLCCGSSCRRTRARGITDGPLIQASSAAAPLSCASKVNSSTKSAETSPFVASLYNQSNAGVCASMGQAHTREDRGSTRRCRHSPSLWQALDRELQTVIAQAHFLHSLRASRPTSPSRLGSEETVCLKSSFAFINLLFCVSS